MVRSYKKTTNRCNIDETVVKKALEEIRNKIETPTSAARKYDLKRTTLISRLKKPSSFNESCDSQLNEIYGSKYTTQQVFSKYQERELVDYFKKCSAQTFGYTYSMARKFAFEYANKNNITVPSSWMIEKEAGIEWIRGLLKRNPDISLRKPENISLARLRGFNEDSVQEFFSNLKRLYEKHNYESKSIFNLDETGISTVLASPKVIAEKGKRSVSQVSSAERGTLVTVVGIVNASGWALPPVYVFPRIRFKDAFIKDGPSNCIGLLSKNGWIVGELFIHVLKQIQNSTNCSKECPILIILNNHSSHYGLEGIDFCRENGIELLSFPPHCSHKLQPLDVSIFGPFKSYCKTFFSEFQINNPGKQITIYDIARLTKVPFQRAFCPENIEKGFKSTGIFPFNSQIFQSSEYITSTLSEDQNKSKSVPNQKENQISPDEIRPVPTIPPPKCINRINKGKSRIYTETPEKNRITELKRKQEDKKSYKANKTNKIQKKIDKRTEQDDSSDSDTFSVADSDKSVGPYVEDDDEDFGLEIANESDYRLKPDDELNIGDYILVKFDARIPKYYVGQITKFENSNEFLLTANFFRKKLSNWQFFKPLFEDVSLVLRSDIELKLPLPEHPAGSSRYSHLIFFKDVDLGAYNVQ